MFAIYIFLGTSAYSRPCLLSQELADVMGADKVLAYICYFRIKVAETKY